jgi:hypothetical protein
LNAKSTGLRVCFWFGVAVRAAEKDSEQHLFECRPRPMTHSWLADAANVSFPPFMSKCAWCSNLTTPYLIIVTHGPLRSFVNIAANGRREPVLQFFCIAANNGFDD